jgi:hypothetical protein
MTGRNLPHVSNTSESVSNLALRKIRSRNFLNCTCPRPSLGCFPSGDMRPTGTVISTDRMCDDFPHRILWENVRRLLYGERESACQFPKGIADGNPVHVLGTTKDADGNKKVPLALANHTCRFVSDTEFLIIKGEKYYRLKVNQAISSMSS